MEDVEGFAVVGTALIFDVIADVGDLEAADDSVGM
jgi:hypothetical protein